MQETGSRLVTRRLIIDELFERERPEAHELFIFIDNEEFSCVAADKKNKKFLALESWNIQGASNSFTEILDEAFSNSVFLSSGKFRNVICCSGFHHSSLIPNPLYEPWIAEDQLRFANPVGKEEEIMTDELRYMEARNVFAVPRIVHEFILSKFQNAEFHHTATAMVDSVLLSAGNSNEETILVNVHLHYMEIIVTRGRELVFYNYFNYSTPEEFTYYILFVFEQLHLNPENADLAFAGEINNSDEIFILTRKYIRNVRFAERPPNYSYSYGFDEIAKHFHYNLFSQLVCVS